MDSDAGSYSTTLAAVIVNGYLTLCEVEEVVQAASRRP